MVPERRQRTGGRHDLPALVDHGSEGRSLERRSHRSRAPLSFSLIGLVLGTVLAEAVILSFGASLFPAASSGALLRDPSAWMSAVLALRDPALGSASLVVGGLPGAVAGRRLAIRRLRSDRLDALVMHSTPTR